MRLKNNFVLETIGIFLLMYAISPYNKMGGFKYYFLLFTIWFCSAYFYYPHSLKKILFGDKYIYACFWGVFLIIYAIIGRAQFLYGVSAILLMNVGLVYLLYKELGWNIAIKRLGMACLLYYTVINVFTLIKLKVDPSISRMLAVTGTTIDNIFELPFTAGFDHVYCMTILITCLTGLLIKRNIRRRAFVFLGALFASMLFILKSGYTYAILLSLVFVILALIQMPNLKRNRYLLICLLIPVIIVGILMIPNVLSYMSDLLGGANTAMGSRIYDLKEILRGGSVAEERNAFVRLELYELSLETWKTHFFLGVGGKIYTANGVVGGHSYVIDLLAYYGLFGGIAFFSSMGIVFINIYKRENILSRYLCVILWSEYIVQLIINPGFSMADTACMFVVVPCILNFCLNSTKRKIIPSSLGENRS